MATRTITIEPTGIELPMPRDGLLTRSYRIGRRFQLTFNQRVAVGVAMMSGIQTWKPHVPSWDDLSRSERMDYRLARNAFAQLVADTTGKEVVILENDT